MRKQRLRYLLNEMLLHLQQHPGGNPFFHTLFEKSGPAIDDEMRKLAPGIAVRPLDLATVERGDEVVQELRISDPPVTGDNYRRDRHCRVYRAAPVLKRGVETVQWVDARDDYEWIVEHAIESLQGWLRWLDALPPPIRLSDAEQVIVDAIAAKGERLDTDALLNAIAARKHVASEGTTKAALAALVRHGLLTQGRDSRGEGYGLPEWGW